jgi:hypothetical protein
MIRIAYFWRIGICAVCLIVVALLSGCASFDLFGGPGHSLQQAGSPSGDPVPATSYRTADEISQPPTQEEKEVIASAKTLIGQPPESQVKVKDRTFVLDCIGTVSAIFYGMNIDVQRDFARYSGNGVSRLYQSLKVLKVLHRDVYPRPGDVIFWDNTWDANGDGILTDDPRTHAGIVLAVDPDGTIHYVHEHVIKGVTVEVMNLRHPRDYYNPQGRVINNALAMNSGISRRNNPEHWVAGDLFDSFGDILRARRHFSVADLAMREPLPAH